MTEKNFALRSEARENINFIYLRGYLDAHTAPQLEDAIKKSKDDGMNKIIVNFSDLSYISSAGLGVFMAFIEEIRESGGDIKLCSMEPKVFTVFDLLGFPLLFEIVTKEEEAINKFNS